MRKKISTIFSTICVVFMAAFVLQAFLVKSASADTTITKDGVIHSGVRTIDITIPENIMKDNSSDDMVDCDKFENVGAMQWILCPVMNNEQYTASWIDNMTQRWLEVKPETYTNSNVVSVWESIRNIANILMIVFLLAIIFSQVTGYGIDNYGIKKMLPRLIMMAIIINLSLYICQLVIDLSNIAGVGLRNMFSSIGMDAGGGTAGDPSFLGGAITGIFAAASTSGGAAAATAGILFTVGAPIAIAVIIMVVVILLVIIIAVMILFLMLGAREIIVVLCVVLSPLAFAAFILPNTQNLFKKWWELFKAAIIIFPICGAMAGISNMFRYALYDKNSTHHIWEYIILMILPYLGFFLIPILLKNALSALGKIGGALTSMGSTIRNGGKTLGHHAMRAGQNTEWYKNRQAEAARNRQSASSQRTIDKLEALKQRRREEGAEPGKELNKNEVRQLARAHEIQRKLTGEDTAASTILMEKEYAGESQDKMLQDWNEAFDNGDTGKMDALTNVIVSRYGPGGVNAIAKRLDGKDVFDADGEFVGGKDGNMARSFVALQANMMQNKGLANAMQNKASDVYQMISSGGYVDHDENGNAILDANGNVVSRRQNLAAHSANNSMATQIKDWATQSTATLERAARRGALSQQMMQDILNSDDPAVQSGIKSDPDKRRVLEAGAAGFNGDWNDKNAVTQAASQYRANIDRERDAREYEQTWQTLLNQRERAEMNANISRIANALNPQDDASRSDNSNPNGGVDGGDVSSETNSGQNSQSDSVISLSPNLEQERFQPPAVVSEQRQLPVARVSSTQSSTPDSAQTQQYSPSSNLTQPSTPTLTSASVQGQNQPPVVVNNQSEQFQPPATIAPTQGQSQPPATIAPIQGQNQQPSAGMRERLKNATPKRGPRIRGFSRGSNRGPNDGPNKK